MSKMFDYISGQAEGRVAELEATLEHVVANCVPASVVDELEAKNAKLRAALKNIVDVDDHRYDGDLRVAFDMAREALKE